VTLIETDDFGKFTAAVAQARSDGLEVKISSRPGQGGAFRATAEEPGTEDGA
jgi:hypothetical protein